jgi:hypothetical protein
MTHNESFADKACSLLEGWMLDPALRMTPTIKYGQGTPGQTNGSDGGMIEFTCESGQKQCDISARFLAHHCSLAFAFVTCIGAPGRATKLDGCCCSAAKRLVLGRWQGSKRSGDL